MDSTAYESTEVALKSQTYPEGFSDTVIGAQILVPKKRDIYLSLYTDIFITGYASSF